jgi:outer membrane protein
MRKVLLTLFVISFIFTTVSNAQESQKRYSVRGVYGWATSKDLGEVVFGKFSPDSKQYKVYSLDGGYLLWKNVNEWPLDIYAKGGLSYYDEDIYDNAYGADLYIKAFWNFDFLKNRVRFGFGEGVSYTTKTLKIEEEDAKVKSSPTSKFLNYLDISLDFDLGKLVRVKSLEDTYVGLLVKHRSGAFGLYNGVHGGSNYNSLYIEKNF